MEFRSDDVFDCHVGRDVANHARRQPVREYNREWIGELAWNGNTVRELCNLVSALDHLFLAIVACVSFNSSFSYRTQVYFSNKSLLEAVEFDLELARRERLLLVYVDVALHNATG